ncbi:hypothetical protein GNI_049570 [Gregarina niphandrodes]|uniref:Uncharacterized protein n=1 Tax=Gregarina niphandrodes TaxID=110365 RepID=A0A023B9N9_GRENI|nr:hypothetical protein GNI_049570 [Gregarina niphandrodes]EZG72980.1 hypothetical protein GNI_049570 [Gregarina niphandrodes]|eukprot:XP_011129675.1 hypothetical protein GNI_049570 [Gregarina niphandrodes]
MKLTSDRRTTRRLLSELHDEDPVIQERAYEALCQLAASRPSVHDMLLQECGIEGLRCAPVEQVGGIKIAPKIKAGQENECYRYATEDTRLLRLKGCNIPPTPAHSYAARKYQARKYQPGKYQAKRPLGIFNKGLLKPIWTEFISALKRQTKPHFLHSTMDHVKNQYQQPTPRGWNRTH